MRAVRLFRALSHQLSRKSINMFISLSKSKLYLQFLSHKNKESQVTHERITNKLSHFIDQNESKYESEQFYKRLTIQYHAELMAEIQAFKKYLEQQNSGTEFKKDITQLTQQVKHDYFKYYYLQIKHQKISDSKKQQNRVKILRACKRINNFNRDLASNIVQRMMKQDVNEKQPTNIRKSIIQLINQHSTIPQFIRQRFISLYDPSKLNYIRNQQQPRFIYGRTAHNSNCFNPTLITCQIIQRVNDAQQLNLLIMGDKKIGKSFSLFHYRLLSEYLPCAGDDKFKFIYFPSVVDALKPSTTAEILFNQYYRQLPKYLLLLIKYLCSASKKNKQQNTFDPNRYISQIKIYEQDLQDFEDISQIINKSIGKQNFQYSTQQKTFKIKNQLTPMQTLKVLINLVKIYTQDFRTTIACFDQFNDLTRKKTPETNKKQQQEVIQLIKLFFSARKRVLSASFHIEKSQNLSFFEQIIPYGQDGPDKKSELVIYELKPANYQQVNQFERQKTYNIRKRLGEKQEVLKTIKNKMEKSQMVKTLKRYNLPFNCEDFKNLNQGIFMQCLKLTNKIINKQQIQSKYQQIIQQQVQQVKHKNFLGILKQLQRWIINYKNLQTQLNQKQYQTINRRYKYVLQMMFSNQYRYSQDSVEFKDLPLRIYNIQTNNLHEFVKQHNTQIYFLLQKFFQNSKYKGKIIIDDTKFIVYNRSTFGHYIQYYFYDQIDEFKQRIFDVFPLENNINKFQKFQIQKNFSNERREKLAQYINNKITKVNQPYIFQTCENQKAVDMVLIIVKLEEQSSIQNIEELQNRKDQLILQICFVQISLNQQNKLLILVQQCEDGYLKGFQKLKWQSGKDQQKIYKYSQIQHKYLLAYFYQQVDKQLTVQQFIKMKKKMTQQQSLKNQKPIKQLQKELEQQLKRLKIVIQQSSKKINVKEIYSDKFKKYIKSFDQKKVGDKTNIKQTKIKNTKIKNTKKSK